MRSLRAIVGLAMVAAGAAPGALTAQGAWNDDATRALIRAAVERRAAQLADTGLVDYTARAHGYLTFLAQLGDGFPLPPILVKSDELMVDLFWGAPDRSKQRIIGRRDTLVLPTDINYHRDHLGVVQNNFPAIIRLGDGDEVRDVPHPLSSAGLAAYDYRITDSLAIRAGDRAIDVLMVSVRPKDDRAPAAVGAVYIDRVTSSVVRMTLSFTRAALKDRQLEDVSVILENGLVDGRFWLPRRQEIEIRRSATWMDFPARGIIRGRWEICCVRTNTGLTAQRLAGPEIVEAPRTEQRSFPFQGSILAGLPEEVRALDAEEVRQVQEDARALVRAGALARARRTAPSARAISDLVRVNRVEGLALGIGISQALGSGFATTAAGRFGTSDERVKGRGSLAWRSGRGHSVQLEGHDDFAEAGDIAEVSGLRNSIAAQEFGSDWTDPFGVRSAALRVDLPVTERSRLSISLSRESHRPLAVKATPTIGRYAPTLAAERIDVWRLGGEWSRAGIRGPSGLGWQLQGRVEGASTRSPGSAEAGLLLRATLDLDGSVPLRGGTLVTRTLMAGVSAGSGVPIQERVFFGGPISAPGYRYHSLIGRTALAQRVEYQVRIPFVSLNLGRFGRVPSGLVLAPFLHAVALQPGAGDPTQLHPSIGIGALGVFDLLRVDVARTLRGNQWFFSVDIARDFWRVM